MNLLIQRLGVIIIFVHHYLFKGKFDGPMQVQLQICGVLKLMNLLIHTRGQTIISVLIRIFLLSSTGLRFSCNFGDK